MEHKTSKEIGLEWEERAKDFLQELGWHHLASNYRSRYGEIDLVFEDGEVIVFIEVKFRSGGFYEAHESVTRSKQRKLILTAETYLRERSLLYEAPWRFDVIEFMQQGQRVLRRHIPQAFDHFQ